MRDLGSRVARRVGSSPFRRTKETDTQRVSVSLVLQGTRKAVKKTVRWTVFRARESPTTRTKKERHRLGVSLFGYAPLARLFNTRGAYPLLRAKSRPSGGCALAQRLRALALSCSPHAKTKAFSFIRIHRADAKAALPALAPLWASQLRRGKGLRTKAPALWCLNNSKPIPRRSPC